MYRKITQKKNGHITVRGAFQRIVRSQEKFFLFIGDNINDMSFFWYFVIRLGSGSRSAVFQNDITLNTEVVYLSTLRRIVTELILI